MFKLIGFIGAVLSTLYFSTLVEAGHRRCHGQAGTVRVAVQSQCGQTQSFSFYGQPSAACGSCGSAPVSQYVSPVPAPYGYRPMPLGPSRPAPCPSCAK